MAFSRLSIFLFFLFILPLSLKAEETVILVSDPYPPFIIPATETSEAAGIGVDMARDIIRPLGYRLEVQIVPWKRALKRLQTGTADITLPLKNTPERAEYLNFTRQTYVTNGLIFSRSDRQPALEWESYRDLKGLQIAVIDGYDYGPEFSHAVQQYNIRLHYVQSIEAAARLVALGRADAFTDNDIVGWAVINSNISWRGKFRVSRKVVDSEPQFLGISKKSPLATKIPEINLIIAGLQEHGQIAALLDKGRGF